MDIEELGELSFEAQRYRIKHTYERIGEKGNEFEYRIVFGAGLAFKNSRAADRFLSAVVLEYKLDELQRYRLPFGWEI
ncbi:hypothetical protein [uncultured Mucilaginibacter sp.]|jgi:hypothetical protein|uniref:hypothetical protein n=1 Tax=uncultured Mucilaginibacter sp. TaxID=797541 RepID=UPI0025F7C6C2|nr:hypothetical protein [uncultured Mucilaginibacter sp.]